MVQRRILTNYFKDLSISDGSKKTYNYALRRLKDLSPNQDLTIINDPNKLDLIISKIARKSRQITYTAVINYLKVNDKDNLKLLTEYRQRASDTQKQITRDRMTQKLDKKIVDNFVFLKDLKKVSCLISKDIQKVQDQTSNTFYKLTQWHLIVNLYIKYPIRLDFGDMEIIKLKDYNKLEDKNTTNYLILDKTKIYVQLNKYKNVERHGQIRYEITRYLKTLIKRWLKIQPDNNLSFLKNYRTKKPMLRQGLHDTLKSIFKKYLNLSNAGVNAIRHARITELNKGQKNLKEKNKECAQFLHSQFEHELYRNL